jgi:hypothetical protein
MKHSSSGVSEDHRYFSIAVPDPFPYLLSSDLTGEKKAHNLHKLWKKVVDNFPSNTGSTIISNKSKYFKGYRPVEKLIKM